MAIDNVHINSGTHDSEILSSAQARMGIGQGLSFDPMTGQITQHQPGTAAGYTNPKTGSAVVKGSDGRYYDADPTTGKPTGSPYTQGYVEQYFQPRAGSSSMEKPTGMIEPGSQIQQGVTDAARLDPNNNLMLSMAGASANDLASGNVGRALGQQVNAGMDATQGRINAQAGDLGIVRDSALGRGPSAAEALAKSQLDANIRSQSAMAATARGGNIAAAMRQASMAGTQQSLQSAQTLNALRAQEQLNAQGLLTSGANNLTNAQGNLGSQRQGLATMQGGLIQGGQAAQSNNAGQYANDQANMNAQKQQAAAKYAEYLMNQYQIASGNQVQYSGQGVQAGIANQKNTMDIIGGLAKTGASLAGGAFGS